MINSLRINTICSFVDNKVVAEIGADHGYITLNLFKTNKIDFAYLTDISKKCLQKAIDNFKQTNYINSCVFMVGDGLNALDHKNIVCLDKESINAQIENNIKENCLKDADCYKKQQNNKILCNLNDKSTLPQIQQVIIAGMGGNEIIKILSSPQSNKYTNFVLQPQRNVVELRKFLQDNMFNILSDLMVREGKIYYNIIKAKKVDKKVSLTEDELLFGKTNLQQQNIYFASFIKEELEKMQEIVKIKPVPEILAKMQKLKEISTKINKGE